MKRTTLTLGVLLAALGAKPAHAEPGLFDKMLPASAADLLRALKDRVTPAAGENDEPVFRTAADHNQRPPQQQPQRRDPAPSVPQHRDPAPSAPPRRDPVPTTPPHRDPAPTTPPHRDPVPTPPPHRDPAPTTPPHRDPAPTTPPHRDPVPTTPPHRDPTPTTPPHRDPNPTTPPHRDPTPTTPPHRDPNPTTPPHRDPNPTTPPHRDPTPTTPPHRHPNPTTPPHRDPNPTTPPRRDPAPTTPPPANQHPPVVVPPQRPGQPTQPGHPEQEHRMPLPPKPIPGGVIDPNRHGDDHAVQPPTHGGDGRRINAAPLQDQHGRYVPPTQNNVTIINNTTIVNNITNVQNNWNVGDHGYYWHDWDGRRVCHHYDGYGYHWWGFYVGPVYFWTRYSDDRYWWYDPYWHRWVYLHDGRWWWEDDYHVTYVIIDNNYYRYGNDGGTVVVQPDPTPPVVTPPAAPSAPAPVQDQTMFYSQDGTRSVQILGDRKEAYLYDLTIADQNDRAARGRWLGAGVKSAKFVYDDKTAADGTQTQVIRQIELTYADDADKLVVADLNGEREIQLSGDPRAAYLYNLKDDTIDPVFLANRPTGVSLINEQRQDASGAVRTRLKLVFVTATDDNGVDQTLMFDRNGAPINAPDDPAPQAGQSADPASFRSGAGATQRMLEKAHGSPTLRALRDGVRW